MFRLFEHPSPQVSPLRTVTEETPADNDDKFVIRLTVGDEDGAGNPARHGRIFHLFKIYLFQFSLSFVVTRFLSQK